MRRLECIRHLLPECTGSELSQRRVGRWVEFDLESSRVLQLHPYPWGRTHVHTSVWVTPDVRGCLSLVGK